MIIDFAKDSSGEVVSISDINKVILKCPSKDNITLLKGSNSKILEPEDFLEYGIDFIPTKYKFNSKFPLELLGGTIKREIGENTEDLERLTKTMFPTDSNEDVDEKIKYFGSITVSEQTLILVKCPSDYEEMEFICGNSVCFTIRFGGERSVNSGDFVKLPKCKYEIDSNKIVWIVIGQDGLVRDINLSYRAWSGSINKFRNLNQKLLRNDDFYKYLSDPEIIENEGETTLWFDRNSGTLLGTGVVSRSNTPILSNKLMSITNNKTFSPYVSYSKGSIVNWDGREWVSLVDNNIGEQFVQLSNKWELKSRLLGLIQKYMNVVIKSDDPSGFGIISNKSFPYEENVTYGIKFRIKLNPGISFRGIWPELSKYNQWEYTRRLLSEVDKADVRSKLISSEGSPTCPFYVKSTGSGYRGYSIEIIPLEGNIEYKENGEFVMKTQEEFIKSFYNDIVSLIGGDNIVVDVPRFPIPIRLYYKYLGKIHNITSSLSDPFEGSLQTSSNIDINNLSGLNGKSTTVLNLKGSDFKYKISLKLKDKYSLTGTEYYHLESIMSGITKEEATEIHIGEYTSEPSIDNISDLIREIGVPVSTNSVSVSNNSITIEEELTANGAPVFIFNLSDKKKIIKFDATKSGDMVYFDSYHLMRYKEVELDEGTTTIKEIFNSIGIPIQLKVKNSSGTVIGDTGDIYSNFTKTLSNGIIIEMSSNGWGTPEEPITLNLSNIKESLTLEFSY